MKKLSIVFIITFFSYALAAHAQDQCKVLKSGINLSYTGGCKNGLAQGQGKAIGIDQYEGQFRKGLPNGYGVYRWSNGDVYEGQWKNGLRHGTGEMTMTSGDKTASLEGRWVRDEFVQTGTQVTDYKVTYKNNIGRVVFTRVGDGDYIRIRFIRNGIPAKPNSFDLFGDSGTEVLTDINPGFQGVVFPFQGKINFVAPDMFHASTINGELRFQILKPGSWDVMITY
jgi:hypothetical protein